MLEPIFDIDKAGMQVVLEKTTLATQMAWQTLFPLKYTNSFDIKAIVAKDGLPVAADRVAFNAKAPKKTRKKVGSWSGELSKISISREKDEVAINEYEKLKVLAAHNAEDKAMANELVERTYEDVQFCSEGLDARVELDAMRVGCSGVWEGKAEYDGDMAEVNTIDFKIPASNKKGAKVAWTDAANADGIGDIADAVSAVKKAGNAAPQFVYMEKAAFELLIAQTATKKRLFPLAIDISLVTGGMIDLEGVNSYMTKKGYPRILLLDTYVTIEDKKGVYKTVKPWDENVVVFSPTINLGHTYYKTVPSVKNTDALQTTSGYKKLTRYSENNPMLEVTLGEAYVQPVLENRNSLVFMNISKTSWK